MKQKTKGQCYFCNSEANSREHAPPRLMFKNFECDSITVPSCEKHNSSKSGDDQAIVHAFLIPMINAEKKGSFKRTLAREIQEAIGVVESDLELTKRKTSSRPLTSDLPDELSHLPDVAYFHSHSAIANWMLQLTAAFIYDARKSSDPKINWLNAGAWSPNWVSAPRPDSLKTLEAISLLESNESTKAIFENRDWLNGWSATPGRYPPNIYSFQLHLKEGYALFKHIFYGAYAWYVWVETSEKTIAKLREKAEH